MLSSSIKFLLLTFVLVSGKALAGLHVEPYVGYEMTKFDYQITGTAPSLGAFDESDDGSASGMAFGGKLGWSLPLVSVGFDYMQAKAEEGALKDYGPFVEFRLPVLLSVRATYFLKSTMTEDTDDGTDEYSGSGYKVGLGFRVLPLLTIGLDYVSTSYDDLDIATSGLEIDKVDVTRKGFLLSLSLPLDI